MARKSYYHPFYGHQYYRCYHGRCVECGCECNSSRGSDDIVVVDRPLTLVCKKEGRKTLLSVKFPAKYIFMCKECYSKAVHRHKAKLLDKV